MVMFAKWCERLFGFSNTPRCDRSELEGVDPTQEELSWSTLGDLLVDAEGEDTEGGSGRGGKTSGGIEGFDWWEEAEAAWQSEGEMLAVVQARMQKRYQDYVDSQDVLDQEIKKAREKAREENKDKAYAFLRQRQVQQSKLEQRERISEREQHVKGLALSKGLDPNRSMVDTLLGWHAALKKEGGAWKSNARSQASKSSRAQAGVARKKPQGVKPTNKIG